MANVGRWIDLLDPTQEELASHLPSDWSTERAATWISGGGLGPRPTLQSRGDHVWGIFMNPVCVRQEDVVYYQDVGVLIGAESIVTIRRTPPGHRPFDTSRVREAAQRGASPGEIAAVLADDVAEAFLHTIDALDDEIDELEERLDHWSARRTYRRLRTLRRDILNVRRVVGPTRDAVRAVLDGRLDVDRDSTLSDDLFPPSARVGFAGAHDKLLRAGEELELARDLLATVRDYHQAQIANAQNEVVRTLTVIASLILLPTFIVGVYGQNFTHMPELGWHYGYAFSWALIVAVTAVQLIFFRRKHWL